MFEDGRFKDEMFFKRRLHEDGDDCDYETASRELTLVGALMFDVIKMLEGLPLDKRHRLSAAILSFHGQHLQSTTYPTLRDLLIAVRRLGEVEQVRK